MKKILKAAWYLSLMVMAFLLCLSVYSQDVNPNDNGWLPFFGICFNIFLWANVILLIILFIRKKVSLIIPLVALVYGWPSAQNYYKIFSKTEFSSEEKKELKMLTYNVRIFDANENIGGNTKDAIFDQLKKEELNLICFQEFYYAETPGEFDTSSLVKKDLGLSQSHEHYTHHMRGGLHSGLATFTSYPLVGKGIIEFDNDINNACIYTDLKVGIDTVRVYNAHLASIRFQKEDYSLITDTEERVELTDKRLDGYFRILRLMKIAYQKRAIQLQKVLDHIYSSPYSVVLAGDFNDTPVSYCYAQTRKYLTDSFVESGSGIGNTYIGDFPSFRIDYVFHDESMESAAYRTLPFELSDHRAVYTKLRVKPE